jgi:hypothetical protein
MSDRQLRSDLIRLAARSTPEVKAALLPLLKTARKPEVEDRLGDMYAHLRDLRESLHDLAKVAKADRMLSEATKEFLTTLDRAEKKFVQNAS